MTKRSHSDPPVRLGTLRQNRPTKPASEFVEAMAREAEMHNLPDQGLWATRAGVERAAELVRNARIAKGLSQNEFAAVAHTTQSVVSDIERGAGSLGPSFSVVARILYAHGFELRVAPHAESEQTTQYQRERACY
jgi:ribosome-binding protein aMBF1 (putative translation factor)